MNLSTAVCSTIELQGVIYSKQMRIFKVNGLLKEYYNTFYNFDIKKFNNLYKGGKKIEEKLININGNFELRYHLISVVNKLLDFSSNFIGLNNSKLE